MVYPLCYSAYQPFRLDIKSVGHLVYIKSSVPSQKLKCDVLLKSLQAIAFELNLRKEKWLVISIYRPPSQDSKFLLNSLTIILDHFIIISRRKQRIKIGSSYSSWHDIIRGVPQGSLFGPLLFNIFINDLFLFIRKSGVCNFADDNTLYSVGKNIENVISDLKTDLVGVMEWFKINSLKANLGKFQFMILGNKDERSFNINIHINNVQTKNSNEVTLLGIKTDKNLTFKNHISELCRRASYKLHTLRRIRKYLTVKKAKLLANAFIKSQFNYAPLIWMFANKCSIDKILKTHKGTL